MYVNAKLIPVETTPGMEMDGGEFKYDTFHTSLKLL
jgi:hypothetical protein